MTIALLIVACVFAAYSLVRAEFDKHELRKELAQANEDREELFERMITMSKRQNVNAGAGDPHDLIRGQDSPQIQRGRAGRFRSFGAEKRRLENQEAPQRSVNQ